MWDFNPQPLSYELDVLNCCTTTAPRTKITIAQYLKTRSFGYLFKKEAISLLTIQKICLILKIPSKQSGGSFSLVTSLSIIDRDKMTFDLQCLVGILERILPFSKSRPPCHGNCQFQKSLWQLFSQISNFWTMLKSLKIKNCAKKSLRMNKIPR